MPAQSHEYHCHPERSEGSQRSTQRCQHKAINTPVILNEVKDLIAGAARTTLTQRDASCRQHDNAMALGLMQISAILNEVKELIAGTASSQRGYIKVG
jgi:hypothetical protein